MTVSTSSGCTCSSSEPSARASPSRCWAAPSTVRRRPSRPAIRIRSEACWRIVCRVCSCSPRWRRSRAKKASRAASGRIATTANGTSRVASAIAKPIGSSSASIEYIQAAGSNSGRGSTRRLNHSIGGPPGEVVEDPEHEAGREQQRLEHEAVRARHEGHQQRGGECRGRVGERRRGRWGRCARGSAGRSAGRRRSAAAPPGRAGRTASARSRASPASSSRCRPGSARRPPGRTAR